MAEHEWEESDAGLDGGDAFDGLEPDWDVVYCDLGYLSCCDISRAIRFVLLKMYCEDPIQIVDQKPAATLRCLRRRGGIVAVLGSKLWTITNATKDIPVRVNNAMIR